MRPKPDPPTPPKGNAGTPANATTALTEVIPERTLRAMWTPCFLAKTAPASP